MRTPKITAEDRKWMARSDAQTLAEAAAIKADKRRMAAATAAAKQFEKEAVAKARAFRDLAKKG